MRVLTDEIAREIASYLRRVGPKGHQEADRLHDLVHALEENHDVD